MRTYHIVTPFQRWTCLPPLVEMLAAQLEALPPDVGLVWYPIFDAGQRERWASALPARLWIWPLETAPRVPGWFMGYWKVNHFLNRCVEALPEDDRILVLNDDDFYEPGFLAKLEQHPGDVVITAMKRGDLGQQRSGHPTSTLTAAPSAMYCGAVGGEQLVASARVLVNRRYGRDYCSDFTMIAEVAKAYPVAYAPDAFVWFNYLEPGRWAESKALWWQP